MNELPQTITTYTRHIMPNMHGWCSPEKAEELARRIIEIKAFTCLEIGAYAGRSLIAMALALKHLGGGCAIGIDPWESDASIKGFEGDAANREWWSKCDHDMIFRLCRAHIKLYGADNVILLPHTSQEARKMIHPPLDLLHIDGNHSEEQSVFDVENYVPLVRSGGTVVFDDTNWSTTARAQQLLANLCAFEKFVESPGQQCAFYRKN